MMKVSYQILKECAEFIGSAPLKIQTTNAQEIYNNLQYFKPSELVVFDFRSKAAFESCHIRDSISIPLDSCAPSDIIKFDEKKFIECFVPKPSVAAFKGRKRCLVIMIPFEDPSLNLLSNLPKLFESSENFEVELCEDEIALRNSILFTKHLISERHRNTYVCRSGMKSIAEKYP